MVAHLLWEQGIMQVRLLSLRPSVAQSLVSSKFKSSWGLYLWPHRSMVEHSELKSIHAIN